MATILVIDDRAYERQYLLMLLQHAGHRVLEAADGLEALAIMSTTTPDLVISDITMPNMDGFELIRRVRERPETGTTPFIFYTARYDETDTRALAEASSGASILPKPAEPDVLLRKVDSILGQPPAPLSALGDEFRSAHLELVTTKLHQRMEDLERANADLSRKESQLRLLTNAVPVLIGFIDTDQHFQFANQAHESWFGQSPDQLRSQHLADVWGKQAYDQLRDSCERALAGNSVTFETRLDLKDETEKYVRAVFVPERDASGRVSGFVALVEDLSETKAIELALRESKSRLELALAVGAIGTCQLDPTTHGMTCDVRYKAAFGLPPDASVDFPGLLAGLHPDDRERVEGALQAALDPAGAGQFAAEFRTVAPADGMVRYLQAQGQAFFDLVGQECKATSLIGTVQDITTRKKAEVELQTANDNLRQFAYAAAHDLQEPLRNIVNALCLLDQTWQEPAEAEPAQLFKEAKQNAQRMVQMMKDLQAFIRIAESPHQRRELVDANEVLKDVLKNLSLSISESRARITWAGLPKIGIAPTHLLQVLQNLIGNALKYRKRDQIPVIQISCEHLGTDWLFTVADNGIGFDPAYSERIFGVFKRLHGKGEYPGTGIGLALCARIVSSYGGRIWAESQPGAGARFRFTLPAKEKRPEKKSAKQSTKVLIVEDNPLDARLVCYALKEEKRWLTEAMVIENGDQAIQYLKEQSAPEKTSRPDLIVLDMNLPKHDGTDVLKTIRATDTLRDLPVFVLSSATEEQSRQRVVSSHVTADQYLTKPPDLDGFLALGGTLRRLYEEASHRPLSKT